MNKRLFSIIFSVILSLSITSVFADEGPYIGLAVGQGSADDVCSDINSEMDEFDISDIGFSCDDSDTVYKFFGGYMFNQNFGVELSYNILGEVNASFSDSETSDYASFSAEPTAVGLALVGSISVSDKFSLFGKVGYANWDVDIKVAVDMEGEVFSESESEGDSDVFYGFGGKYRYSESIGLRLEWERFDLDGLDVDAISVGFQLHF